MTENSVKPARRHPLGAAFDRYRQQRWDSFNGNASGPYLANRLQLAFQEGWAACERAVKAAMSGEEQP